MQTLCRTARITDEIAHIILYGAHTIVFDHRQKYCKIEQVNDFHQLEFVTFINRGLRHARLFAERAARSIRNNLSEDFALTLDHYWIQRCMDGPSRKIRRKSVAIIAAGWVAWARSIRESNTIWLSKPNPALGRLVADLIRGDIMVDDSVVEEYIPMDDLDNIYIPQSIERRLQRTAIEKEICVEIVTQENYTINTHKENLTHYWVTNDFADGEVGSILV